MSKLSCSFTLGKAGKAHGANIEHNHRDFISSNVDVSRTPENVCYIRKDVRETYNELFEESLAEYNENQTRKDRVIHNYFEHISEGNREEPYYEIIVQFGERCILCTTYTSLIMSLTYAVLTRFLPKFGTVNSSCSLMLPTKR
jgi:hypothetical protein